MKTINVVIPAKNREEFTREAITSVVRQKLPSGYRLEVVVVDNRSDRPLETVMGREFPEVIFLRNNRFDSPGGTRNVGLDYCHGQYVAFLDNDDTWKQGFLKDSVRIMSKICSAGTLCLTDPYFYGRYPVGKRIILMVLNVLRSISLRYLAANDGSLPKSAFYLGQISHMLFDRERVGKIRFREKTAAAEDWEFICRVMGRGTITIIPRKMVNFRYESRSNTNTDKVRLLKWHAYLKLLDRLSDDYKSFPWHQLFLRYIDIFS